MSEQKHSEAAPARPETSVDQLVVRLRRYNEWRRGAEIEQPDPKALGEDIDAAADILEIVVAAKVWRD